MSEFSISEMLTMQKTLQEKYKDKWEKISPDAGKHKLLWMIGEIGEVIEIIKKNGDAKVVEDNDLRRSLIEESIPSATGTNDKTIDASAAAFGGAYIKQQPGICVLGCCCL